MVKTMKRIILILGLIVLAGLLIFSGLCAKRNDSGAKQQVENAKIETTKLAGEDKTEKDDLISRMSSCLDQRAPRAKNKIPLILAEEIPAIGEKTNLEKKKAAQLNKIIGRWNASMVNIPTPSDILLSKISNISYDVDRFNCSIQECASRQTEDAYYQCRSANAGTSYESANPIIWEGLVKGKWHLSDAEAKLVDPPANTKTSATCAHILKTKLIFPAEEYSWAVYTDDEDPAVKHLVYTKYSGTLHDLFLHKNLGKITLDGIKGLPDFEEIDEPDSVNIFALPRNETVKMFVIDNTPYVSLMASNAESYAIYELNKEALFFDTVCTIEGTVQKYVDELGKYPDICNRIMKKKYEEIKPANLRKILSPQEYKAFAMDFIGEEEIPSSGFLEMKQSFSSLGIERPLEYQFYADYRNEGKKHIVIPMDLSSGRGPGCEYDFHVAYTPGMQQKFNDISNLEPEMNQLGDCGSENSLIRVKGKIYVLNTDGRGLTRLWQIKKKGEDVNTVETICVFKPVYRYE